MVEDKGLMELAEFLYAMRYEDLRDLGRELHGMTTADDNDPPVWDLSRPSEWSEMIFCWAETNRPIEDANTASDAPAAADTEGQ